MRQQHSPYKHLLYAGGWLLAHRRHPVPAGWRSRRFGPYRLSVPRRSPVGAFGPIVVIGRPVDPISGFSGARAAARQLTRARRQGWFLDQLDQLSGRFIVIVNDPDGPRIYQDAAGARAVFYRPHVAASHSALVHGDPGALCPHVGEIWGRATRTLQGVKYLPGIRAPHTGVWMLTPNTSLHVLSGTVSRFWPRLERREDANTTRLAERVAQLMTSTVREAVGTWPLSMSLTAGLDSRLALAACRLFVDRMTFFSHINPDDPRNGHQVDLDVAGDMADRLGLEHLVYPLGAPAEGDGYPEFRQVWRTNMGIARGVPTLMKGYADNWPGGTLHLRSNVAEIGRVFYKGHRLDRVTPDGLTRWWNPHLRDDPDCVASFAEFAEVTGFTDDAMLGYDPLDVFYWEHRMGSWHAWLCTEADVAHDTFPVYSNRRLLEAMLAAPFAARAEARVFHETIGLLWPEVAEWPINPPQWPVSQ